MVQAALPHLMQAMPPGLAAAYGGLPQHQHQPVVQLPAQAAAAAAAALENARKRRAAEVAGGAPPLKQQQLAPGSIPQQDGPADDACEGPSAGGVVKSEGEDAGAALGEDLAGSDEELNEDDDLAGKHSTARGPEQGCLGGIPRCARCNCREFCFLAAVSSAPRVLILTPSRLPPSWLQLWTTRR